MKDNEVMISIISSIVAVIITSLVYITASSIGNMKSMPACTEDATIIGQGEYTNGRWDYYVCGPVYDDLQ